MQRVRATVRSALAPEDLLLSGWAGLAQPLLFTASAAPSGGLLGVRDNPVLGVLYVLAGFGAVVALLTRDLETPPASFAESELGIFGPTAAGVVMVFIAGYELFGASMPEGLIGIVFIAALGSPLAQKWLPAVPQALRRVAVTPFVMAAAGLFDQTAVTILELFDLRVLGEIRTREELSLVITIGGMIIAVSAIFYAMLVVAPRRLAGDRSGRVIWGIRYTMFAVSVLVGATLGGALA